MTARFRDPALRPVAIRTGRRRLRCTAATEAHVLPLVSEGSGLGVFGRGDPGRLTGFAVTVTGAGGRPNDGRFEMWCPAPEGTPRPLVYWRLEGVEWSEVPGGWTGVGASEGGGFMYVERRLEGRREFSRVIRATGHTSRVRTRGASTAAPTTSPDRRPGKRTKGRGPFDA